VTLNVADGASGDGVIGSIGWARFRTSLAVSPTEPQLFNSLLTQALAAANLQP
jgi:hypothetical protein